MPVTPGVEVEIRKGRTLVVKARNNTSRALFRKLHQEDERKVETRSPFEGITKIKDEVNEDDVDGPNRRGTYSKSYILLHPEIEWVHRGQGRYLPASHQSRKSYSNRSDR